jgi:hypothetical protein
MENDAADASVEDVNVPLVLKLVDRALDEIASGKVQKTDENLRRVHDMLVRAGVQLDRDGRFLDRLDERLENMSEGLEDMEVDRDMDVVDDGDGEPDDGVNICGEDDAVPGLGASQVMAWDVPASQAKPWRDNY